MENKGEGNQCTSIRQMLGNVNNLKNPAKIKSQTKTPQRRKEFFNAIKDNDILLSIKANVKVDKVSKEAKKRVYSINIQDANGEIFVRGLGTVEAVRRLCHGVTHRRATGEEKQEFEKISDEIENLWPDLNLNGKVLDDSYYVFTFGNKAVSIGIFQEEKPEELKSFKVFSKIRANSKNEVNDIVSMLKSVNPKLSVVDFCNNKECDLYIDGSFRKDDKSFSYGFLVLDGKKKVVEGSRRVFSHPWKEYRNVAGELSGAREGIRVAIENGFNIINVHYDFAGIETYVERPDSISKKNDLAFSYLDEINNFKNMVDINFIKIKSHSGNKFNNYVDRLAKNA